MLELFQVLGGIAGFGGVALGVLFLLYRDLVRNIIQHRMFRTLTSGQATGLFGAVIVFAFAIAILGIFATLAVGEGAQQFMILVGILLAFLLASLLVVGRLFTGGRRNRPDPGATEERSLAKVARLIAANEPDQAQRALDSAGIDREAEEFWYWKARIALARSNPTVAAGYVDEALKIEPRNGHSIALKIRILLVGRGPADRDEAVRLAAASEGISSELDVWLRLLRAEGMFDVRVRTNTELDERCPLPARHGQAAA
ncbi:hypothetical protein ACFCZ1_33810 [Streptomyces sp. NPDC056224]|uniref:hypothetical protein n=1 Tax=Streptomyces sp. NPDC056224 TaxID=3345750 RepID=UPI0035DB72BF